MVLITSSPWVVDPLHLSPGQLSVFLNCYKKTTLFSPHVYFVRYEKHSELILFQNNSKVKPRLFHGVDDKFSVTKVYSLLNAPPAELICRFDAQNIKVRFCYFLSYLFAYE